MFCPKCGANNDNVASSCHSCNASFSALNAGDRVANAAKDAFSSFKLFLKNPVGDLHTAFESLGKEKALGVGMTFGVAFAILVTFLATTKLSSFLSPSLSVYLKILIVSFVPFVSLSGAGYLLRQITRSEASLGHDTFIAGAALLPLAAVAILAFVLGFGNIEIISLSLFFAMVVTVMMLFMGTTRIYKITEQQATLFVPSMIVFSAWITKILYAAMFDKMF
jgi:hypothetical protein